MTKILTYFSHQGTVQQSYLPQSRAIIINMALLCLLGTLLSGCDNNSANHNKSESNQMVATEPALASLEHDTPETTIETNATTEVVSTRNAPLTIDWSKIDSGMTKSNISSYDYPFGIDEPAVSVYAEYFHITPEQAQHSLVLGTASNEPLLSILEQLGDSYLSHKLNDGADISLVIYTTPNVTAERHDYVLSSEFAKGLVLPIIIEPKPVLKPSPH